MTAAARLALALILLAVSVTAEESHVIGIEKHWIAESPPGVHVAAAYGVITCDCVRADRLVSVAVVGAAMSELHATTSGDDGVVAMRRLDDGIAIDPGTSLVLEPGGLHIMIMGLEERPQAGDRIPVTLVFEKAGAVDVVFPVATRSAAGTEQ
ncbi:MAG: copper chaperone PCu(A)C [bacterium]|nr:copper chaperone PCu(A)C [bacterium]